MSASRPRALKFSFRRRSSSGLLYGLVRDVPRIVPPRDLRGDEGAAAGDAELVKVEGELGLEVAAQRAQDVGRKGPHRALEGPVSLLARLVDELLLGLTGLPLVRALACDPRADLP